VVGDKRSDLGLAEVLGVPGILVLTGAGRAALEANPTLPRYVAADLVEAAAIITSLRPERSEGITHLTTAPSSARGLLDPQSEPDNLQPMPPSDDHLTAIHDYLHQSAGVLRATADDCAEDIAKAVDLLVECYRGGGKVLLCGNGGSAADCQHMAAELMNVLSRDRHRPPLAAVALTTDTSLLTAIANDFGYERVFERQVEALGRPGDVLIGISTSGNSPNVIRALTRARTQGCRTVLMTGASGGAALAHADVAILVPAADPQQVQQAHSSIGHLVCGRVERELYG
jgi:D-sedoheptulose 7-phosphate isomerase